MAPQRSALSGMAWALLGLSMLSACTVFDQERDKAMASASRPATLTPSAMGPEPTAPPRR